MSKLIKIDNLKPDPDSKHREKGLVEVMVLAMARPLVRGIKVKSQGQVLILNQLLKVVRLLLSEGFPKEVSLIYLRWNMK